MPVPALMALAGVVPSGPAALDTQTVTVAQTGTAGAENRVRGFVNGSQGSISDGTSNIFGGGAITQMAAVEVGPSSFDLYLTIAGSTNSGWTTMTNTTDGNSLTRAAASFNAGTGTWTWTGLAIGSFFASTTGAKTIEFS